MIENAPYMVTSEAEPKGKPFVGENQSQVTVT